MRTLFCVALLALAAPAPAQQFDFPQAALTDSAALSQAMPSLARQLAMAYKEDDRQKYLDQLFRLQIVAGQYDDALKTIAALRELLRTAQPPRSAWVNAQYEIYLDAKMGESAGATFADAYAQAFHDAFAHLDDRTSALVIREFGGIDPADAQRDLQVELDKQKGKNSIALPDALKLIAAYQVEEAYRAFAAPNAALIAEDDNRRYLVQKDIRINTPDGATICALLMRPRSAPARIPTLLKFTIYVDPFDNPNDARQTASNGYAGVVGFTRGKACSPDKPVPYLHDGPDAATLIDWIAAQSWSDGRVGMYGGSYEGFTQWATAKQMPKALKAIMAGAPAAPGIDVPMEGNIFWNFIYPWPFYTTDLKGPDDAVYNDRARWQKLNRDWYVSGRAYRDLDKIDGTPNPIFDEWIAHPSYDAYWQSMIPYQKDFARINIPVLQTAGYYFGGPGAAVYYLNEHYKYNPHAEHYLVIGPYDHIAAQFGVIGLVGNVYDTLSGMQLDPVAQIDLTELRYQWFDYIFKGAPKPALLQDKINYELTGANQWKHAPSLAAMAGDTMNLCFSGLRSVGNAYRFNMLRSFGDNFVSFSVDYTDRTDVDRAPAGGVLDNNVDVWNGVQYISFPLPGATEVSGLFSGHLDFMANKNDFDFEIDLYEKTAKGEYVLLTSYWTRASYAEDPTHRHLLTPGKRQTIGFQSRRLMSRQLQPGSRILMVLSLVKEPGRQINYGTGKDVSDETIQDAKEPLEVKWYNQSCLTIPLGK